MNPRFCDFIHPFFIAEIGGNHEGDFEYAKRLLLSASRTGAQAVKFQTYAADKIVSKVEAPDRHVHFKKFELGDTRFLELSALAQERGVMFMSSLWDKDSVRALDPVIPIHKVGSGDLTNFPLLRVLAATNKPLILSTALATLSDVREAVAFVQKCNPNLAPQRKLAVLHCVAMYGEPRDEYAQLNAIRVLQESFPNLPIGYSDHTVGTYACELALAMGACIIEKHFTNDTTRTFRDHHIAATEESLKALVDKSIHIESLLGKQEKAPVAEIETPARIQDFRRAVYLLEDSKAGTILTEQLLTTLRPLKGIDARRYDEVVGKRLTRDKKALEAFAEDDIA